MSEETYTLLEAFAKVMADPTLCCHPWSAGYSLVRFGDHQFYSDDGQGRYGRAQRLDISRPEDIFMLWRVRPFKEVEEERRKQWEAERQRQEAQNQ